MTWDYLSSAKKNTQSNVFLSREEMSSVCQFQPFLYLYADKNETEVHYYYMLISATKEEKGRSNHHIDLHMTIKFHCCSRSER